MEELILFCMCYALVFLFYQLFLITPRKKNKKKEKELLEIRYLEVCYHLDLKKVSYPQLLQICALVSSFDISLTVSIISHMHNFLLEIFGGLLIVIIVIAISYHFVYLFYKKKGMILNGKN